MSALRTIKRVAKAVKLAISPPAAIGIERAEYASPSLGDAPAPEHAYTGEYEGRTYKLFSLLGHPRSGTNWTSAILERHPKVSVYGEFRFEALCRAFEDMRAHPWHAAYYPPIKAISYQCQQETFRRMVAGASVRRPEAEWIGERTPRHLDVIIPGMPHFMVVRDPRDVIVSLAHQEFSKALTNFNRPEYRDQLEPIRAGFEKDRDFFHKNPDRLLCVEGFVRHLAGKYAHHVGSDLRTLERIERGEILARVHVVRYERIHQDPEGQRAAMYRFLGLDPAEALPLDEGSLSSPGFAKERPEEFYRKGRVGDWRTYFTPDARKWFNAEAGEILVRLGYETDLDW